ncbi:hypothetical protein AXF42_Ash016371 [Apostasia shenzhenica]|uniref:Uncharacterized protein n=1 Tax=Apostasia shenzhenica TaxID=1088818 RepID=A0A2H9ZZX8_9ASPA|nr:hypothetical protein AXF42_Ash016371 [Apostasia shenzhenica]
MDWPEVIRRYRDWGTRRAGRRRDWRAKQAKRQHFFGHGHVFICAIRKKKGEEEKGSWTNKESEEMY